MNTFEWTKQRERAAALIAKGELTMEQIADEIDCGVATLYRWKDNEEFIKRVAENVAKIREAVLSQEIGEVYKRVSRLNKRWQQIDQLITARASDPRMMDIPGGSTGLLCHELKSIGGGENAQVVDVYRFDAALIKEERELAKQAAQECGQWMERSAVDLTSGGKPIESLTDEERAARTLALLEQARARRAGQADFSE